MTTADLNFVIAAATAHGRMQFLNELIEAERPLLNNRLVGLLRQSNKRQWNAMTYEQRDAAARFCGDKRDDETLRQAFEKARKV